MIHKHLYVNGCLQTIATRQQHRTAPHDSLVAECWHTMCQRTCRVLAHNVSAHLQSVGTQCVSALGGLGMVLTFSL
jgi:hypothetical protein